MQKKTETVIAGVRSSRNKLKKLLAITKDTQMMKSREASWETYGKLQQGIDLLTQTIIISEGEDGLKTLLEQQEVVSEVLRTFVSERLQIPNASWRSRSNRPT